MITPIAIIGLFVLAVALALADVLTERRRIKRASGKLAPGAPAGSSKEEDPCGK